MGLIEWCKNYLQNSRILNEKYENAYKRIFEAPDEETFQIRLGAWDYAHRVTRDYRY